MIEITLESAIEGVTAIVEEFGENYVYERPYGASCLYVFDGQPSCIVGKFLAKVGVPLERLARADEARGVIARDLIGQLEYEDVIATDVPEVGRFLDVLQSEQDSGYHWGEALKLAKTVV